MDVLYKWMFMKKGLLALFFALCVGNIAAFAQMTEDPTSWSFSKEKTGENEYDLILEATLQPGWSIYSMYTPAGGPMPVSLTVDGVGKGKKLK